MSKGYIKIRLEGNNFAAFVSAAANGGITLSDMEREEKTLKAVCLEKDEWELRRIAARCGLLLFVEGRKNLKSRADGLLRHIGAITALVVVVATFIMSRFFVFSVAVEGVSPARASEILAALKEEGVDGITLKSKLDLAEIEKTAVEGRDDLAFAEAYIDGVRLVVSVREQLPSPVENEEKGKLIASVDAIVTRVEVSGGTALVKAGDTVRKGQTLIGDYIIVGNHEDPEHKEIETAAEGDVYGRVWYTERLLIPEIRQETVRTGEKYTSTALYIGDRLMLAAKSSHGFSQYEKVTEVKKINAVIPFTLVTETYYETTVVNEKTDEAYLENQAYEAFARLYAGLDPEATVLASYKTQKKVDNYYIIILYYEVEQLIGCREA